MREPVVLLPIGAGRKATECKTLSELRAWYRGKELAMREGKQKGLWLRCPHCREKFDAQTQDDLWLVPNRGADETYAPARQVECPKCTREFKAEPPAGWAWQIWP
jgi:DNA-directed RNA polymerase subunit RPC12/RpoP